MEMNIEKHLETTKAYIVPVSKIKPESERSFKVEGNRIPIASQAFKDILKISGVTKKMLVHMNETLGEKAGLGLVNHLVKALGEKQGMKVKVLIDISENKIVRIALAGDSIGKAVPAKTFSNLLEYLQANKNVSMLSQSVEAGGTKVITSLKWDRPIPLAMKGEDISYGKEIEWDMFGDVVVRDLVERLVCTNGMTGFTTTGTQRLTAGSSPGDWYNTLIKSLSNPDITILKEYEKNVFNAMQTNMSVAEYNKVKAHAAIWKDDAPKVMRYLGDERWKDDYKAKGIELEKLNVEQLKNCPTPVNKWDGINLLTDLASHDYNSKVGKGTKVATQKLAGQFLRKTADEDRMIQNTPKFGRSKPGKF